MQLVQYFILKTFCTIEDIFGDYLTIFKNKLKPTYNDNYFEQNLFKYYQ